MPVFHTLVFFKSSAKVLSSVKLCLFIYLVIFTLHKNDFFKHLGQYSAELACQSNISKQQMSKYFDIFHDPDKLH